MFKGFPADLTAALATEPLTANSHRWSLATSVRCFSVELPLKARLGPQSCAVCLRQAFDSNLKLKKFYKVLSTNSDGSLEFVSTIEGKSTGTRQRRTHAFPDRLVFVHRPQLPRLRDAVAPGEEPL